MARLKYTKDEIDERLALIGMVSNPNLLNNPFFEVNQRGFASGSGATGAYVADRWVTYGYTSSVVTRTSAGRIEHYGGVVATASSAVRQWLSCGYLPAGTYTLSVKVTGGVLNPNGNYGYLSARNGNTPVGSQPNLKQIGITSHTFTVGENEVNNISISVYKDATIEYECLKLERGEVSTLKNDIAPDYGEELLKCQRYYQRFNSHSTSTAFGSGIVYGGYAYFSVPTPVSLRTAPSIMFSDLAVVTDAISAADAVTVHAWSENNVKLRCASAANNGAACVLQSSALTGYIGLSADL